jgi:Na+/melibiose symporter-like transporter
MNTSSQKVSVFEKIGYSFGDLAANLIFQTLVTYLAYFYTDIYGLKAADASIVTLVVGLVAAFGFNPVVGVLADRTNSRWGKFRPWILYTAVPMGVVALLAFSTPNFSYKWKIIYAAVTYSLLLLLYASSNLPYSALSGVITGDMGERNSISSYRFVAVMFAQFFVQVFMLPIIIYAGHGDKAAGIEEVMTWMAIIGTVLLLATFLTTKERIVPNPEQKSTLREDLSDLSKNKPWFIMLTLTILLFVTLAMKGGSYVYYFYNYVDKDSLAKFISPVIAALNSLGINFFGSDPVSAGLGLFNAGGIIFQIVGISFSKKLADKYGKRDVFKFGLFVSTIFIFIFLFFSPTNVYLMFGSQILHGFFYGLTVPILWAMIADVADFSEYKTSRRATAIIFSAMMVGLKAGLSIGSALVTWILGLYGYIGKAGTIAGHTIVQPGSVATGAKMLVSVFPSIPFLIGFGLLFFYVIDKKMEVKIETELKSRRVEKKLVETTNTNECQLISTNAN